MLSSRSYAPAWERPGGSPSEPALAVVAGRETGNEPVNLTSSAGAGSAFFLVQDLA